MNNNIKKDEGVIGGRPPGFNSKINGEVKKTNNDKIQSKTYNSL